MEELKEIAAVTDENETLKVDRKYINEWPSSKCLPAATRKFLPYQDELSIVKAVFKGEWIVISRKDVQDHFLKTASITHGNGKDKIMNQNFSIPDRH